MDNTSNWEQNTIEALDDIIAKAKEKHPIYANMSHEDLAAWERIGHVCSGVGHQITAGLNPARVRQLHLQHGCTGVSASNSDNDTDTDKEL